MSKMNTALLALLFAGLSAGFGLCMSVVHYATWAFVPPVAFSAFQDTSAVRTVPLAVVLGLPSLLLAAATAYRGLASVGRTPLWVAAALALVPWVATPLVLIPIQARLAAEGPTAELVTQLLWNDLILRSLPPIVQSAILLRVVGRSLGRTPG